MKKIEIIKGGIEYGVTKYNDSETGELKIRLQNIRRGHQYEGAIQTLKIVATEAVRVEGDTLECAYITALGRRMVFQ